ncbi:MAG: hypothetical protein ABSE73_16145 [Planctomycetota bacterium]
MSVYEYRDERGEQQFKEFASPTPPEIEGWHYLMPHKDWEAVRSAYPKVKMELQQGHQLSEGDPQERSFGDEKQNVLERILAKAKEASKTAVPPKVHPTRVHIDPVSEQDFRKLTVSDTEDEKFLRSVYQYGVRRAIKECWKGKVYGLIVEWNADELKVE